MRVHPGTRAAGRLEDVEPARGRGEPARHVLGVDPALDRVPGQPDRALLHRQRLPGGHLDLLPDQVHSGDHLGDRVLDLDPGVHLHEPEPAVVVQQELDRTRAPVPQRLGAPQRDLAQLLAQSRVDRRRRGLLDELLVPPLYRAVPLAEVHGVAVLVADDLYLDMARRGKVALEVDRAVPQRCPGAGPGRRVRVAHVGELGYHADAPPTATGYRLENDRVADLLGGGVRLLQRVDRRRGARQQGQPRLGHQGSGLCLVADRLHHLWRRPDEDYAVVGADLGEVRVFGEEPVAGVDRVGAGLQGRPDHVGDVQVAVACRGRADANGLVGELHRERLGVRGRVDGHGTDAELAAGTDDPYRDLPPVGHQDLGKHPPPSSCRRDRDPATAGRTRPSRHPPGGSRGPGRGWSRSPG